MRTSKKTANIIYNGLNVNCEITSIDPLDQVYYAGSDTYIPNRVLTPLVLIPKLEVVDVAGNKVGLAFTKAKWYLGEIAQDNLITSRVNSDDFYLDGLNLVVKKNLTTPIQVSFLGEYLDKRTNKTIRIPKVVELSVNSTSEIAPAPTIGIDRPSDWAFNPIKDNPIQTLTASVFVNEKAYQSAAKWLVEFEGKKELIDLYNCYVNGQDSDKLTIDTSKLPSGALVYAENLSEEVHSRFYGINPEWDGRMSEVLENRNLLALAKRMQGVFIYQNSPNYLAINENSQASSYVINVLGMQSISVSVSADSVFENNRFGLAFYKEFKHGDLPLSIPFNFQKGKPDADKYENIEVPKGATIAVLYYSNVGIDNIPTKIKLEQGDKATSYTPAPEDLNYRNLVVNSSNYKGTKGWRLLGNSLNLRIEDDYLAYDAKLNDGGWKGIGTEQILSINKGDKYYSAFEVLSSIKLTSENSPILDVTLLDTKAASGGGLYYSYQFEVVEVNKIQTISGLLVGNKNANDAYLRIRHSLNTDKTFTLKLNNIRLINLTEKFGAGNEPSKEICDEIFADYGYIPAPEDLAPSGIVPGEYSTSVPFFVKYPALEVDIDDFGDIPEDETEQTFNAVVGYNKGQITNPSKYLDMQFILSDDSAGGTEETIGEGNSVTIATAKLRGNKSILIDWQFKSRPQTLTKLEVSNKDIEA